MVTRYLPRDFIDIAALLGRYSRTELMRLTFTRDPGLRVVDFIEAVCQLDRTPNDKFSKYGMTDEGVSAIKERFADWPRHEVDDHEGRAVHAAVAAEEQAARASRLASTAYPQHPETSPDPSRSHGVDRPGGPEPPTRSLR
jgi:hypothetical protein